MRVARAPGKRQGRVPYALRTELREQACLSAPSGNAPARTSEGDFPYAPLCGFLTGKSSSYIGAAGQRYT
jgi:hypothetical protein